MRFKNGMLAYGHTFAKSLVLTIFVGLIASKSVSASNDLANGNRREAACREKLVQARARNESPDLTSLTQLRGAFEAEVRNIYGKAGHEHLIRTGAFEAEFKRLLRLHQDSRALYLDQIEKRLNEQFERKRRYESRYNQPYQGDVCIELERYSFVEKTPFLKRDYHLFKDIDRRQPFLIGFDDLAIVQKEFRDQIEAGCAAEELKWLSVCFLAPLDLESAKASTFRSNHVVCMIPKFVASLSKTAQFYGDFKWIPYFKSRTVNVRSRGCVVGSRDSKSLALRSSVIRREFEHREPVSPLSPTLNDAVASGSVSGKIVDVETGLSLEGVGIRLETEAKVYRPIDASTDTAGGYRLAGLPMAVEKHAIIHVKKHRYQIASSPLDRMLVGRNVDGYHFALEPIPVNITGTALNAETLQPIASEPIQIRVSHILPNGQRHERVFETHTDSTGRYVIERVPNTWNRLQAQTATRAFVDPAEQTIDLWGNGHEESRAPETVTIDLKLVPRRTLISGRVISSRTNAPLAGIHVDFDDENGEKIASLVTDAEGKYELQDNQVPTRLTNRRLKVQVYDSKTVNPNIEESSNYHSVTEDWAVVDDASILSRSPKDSLPFLKSNSRVLTYVSNPNRDFALKPRYVTVSGKLLHGENGSNVSGVQVRFTYRGRPYSVQADGTYFFENVPPGQYRIEASKAEFSNYSTMVTVRDQDAIQDLILLPRKYSYRRIVAVLTWGATPQDLDSHLFGRNKILNYKTLSDQKLLSFLNADLDRDDTSGYGPETTIIKLDDNGNALMDYKFMVYNYSQEIPLSRTGVRARVAVFRDGEFIREFNSETASNREDGAQLWYVFAVVGNQIVPRHSYEFSELYQGIKQELEQIQEAEGLIRGLQTKIERIKAVTTEFRKAQLADAEIRKEIQNVVGESNWRTSSELEALKLQAMKQLTLRAEILRAHRNALVDGRTVDLETKRVDARTRLEVLRQKQTALRVKTLVLERQQLEQEIESADFSVKLLEDASLGGWRRNRFRRA